MKTVYLSLGSNIGDRLENLRSGVEELTRNYIHVTRVAPIYETEPQGVKEQTWFLNTVVAAEVNLFPMQLLLRINKIEQKLRRKRIIVNGPRTLDIDILFFGNTVVSSGDLEIPHPRYASRRFVLAPLVDIAPELRDPMTHARMKDLLAALKGQDARRTELSIELKQPA